MYFSESNFLFNLQNLPEKNNMRCPKCHLIPFITFDNKNPNTFLYLQCDNKHNINGELKELYKNSRNFQIDSIKCQNCNENNISKINYCIDCYGFFCEKESHSLNKKHYEIPLQKIDCCCREKGHINQNVISYCHKHKKNICNNCKQEKHQGDEIENFVFLKEEKFETIKNNIQNCEEKLKNLNKNITSFISFLKKLSEQIRTEFEKFKEKNELEIKIAYDIINIYEYKKNNNSINYQIIQNVKNIIFNKIDFNFEQQKFAEIKDKLLSQFKNHFIEISNNNNIRKKKTKNKDNSQKSIEIQSEETKAITEPNQSLYELREIFLYLYLEYIINNFGAYIIFIKFL